MFENWSWEDTWGVVLIASMALCVGFVLFAIAQNHDVDGYYFKSGSGNTGICVYNNSPWNIDDVVFCTNDYNVALDFVTKANATVKK